jgi:alpha-glucosidase (family GH31 glycosyl hydrolase)
MQQEKKSDGVELNIGSVTIALRRHAPHVVRISLGTRALGAPSSYLNGQVNNKLPAMELGGSPVSIRLGELSVEIDPTSQELTFCDSSGRRQMRLATNRLTLVPRVRLFLGTVGEQHFYGLGEGGHQFDRLGVTRRLWNFQANRGQGADIAVPLLISQSGYAVFIDNSAAAMIEPGELDGARWLEYSAAPGPFDLYFFGGPDLRSIFGDVADLVGHATMPPRWALGYMQSSRHFDDAEEFHRVTSRMREGRHPCDAFIFLSTYGTALGWNRMVGHLEFEPSLIPDPAATIKRFHDKHFRVFSHEYPVLHEKSPLYAEALRNGYLLDHAYPHQASGSVKEAVFREGQRFLDFSREEVRTWWWEQHRPLVAAGIEGWWLDGGEGPPAHTELKAGPGTVLHNRYDLLRQQAFAEGEARDNPDRRPYLLCRSGGPGMQRFGAMPWSGDINTTFETMEMQIRTGLNLAMSGVPHWGTDTGGFYLVGPDEGELFVRWLQFSAFCSIFRAHGHVWRRHLPWSHGEAIETICRQIIELRYRMMPYTYSLVWQAHRLGLPTMRPLVLNYPNDPHVWDLGTQYLWGDDILVAPVTRRGATHWTVYLPEGQWHDFWTHEAYQGQRGVTVAAPLERLPLFVRSGAIIPLGPVMQYDGESELDEITLLIYPDGESTFALYEDDGASNAYRDGGYAITTITSHAEASRLTVGIAPPEGDASIVSKARRYTLQIRAPKPPERIDIEGLGRLAKVEQSNLAGWWHDGAHFLFVRLPTAAATAQIVW